MEGIASFHSARLINSAPFELYRVPRGFDFDLDSWISNYPFLFLRWSLAVVFVEIISDQSYLRWFPLPLSLFLSPFVCFSFPSPFLVEETKRESEEDEEEERVSRIFRRSRWIGTTDSLDRYFDRMLSQRERYEVVETIDRIFDTIPYLFSLNEFLFTFSFFFAFFGIIVVIFVLKVYIINISISYKYILYFLSFVRFEISFSYLLVA